jgi:hypothetical protein
VLVDEGRVAFGDVGSGAHQEWVLTRLMENAERALQHVAVLDKERKPTGEYRYDGSVANRALELAGHVHRPPRGRPA